MACHDVAVNWLASEMQHICAKVNHASSVLASLSQHGISDASIGNVIDISKQYQR